MGFHSAFKGLSQPNEKTDAKQEGIQHTKARLGEVLKNKWTVH